MAIAACTAHFEDTFCGGCVSGGEFCANEVEGGETSAEKCAQSIRFRACNFQSVGGVFCEQAVADAYIGIKLIVLIASVVHQVKEGSVAAVGDADGVTG